MKCFLKGHFASGSRSRLLRQGGKTGKIECPLAFMELWQWEKKNKTGHNGGVEQTFPRFPSGFHVLPDKKRDWLSNLHWLERTNYLTSDIVPLLAFKEISVKTFAEHKLKKQRQKNDSYCRNSLYKCMLITETIFGGWASSHAPLRSVPNQAKNRNKHAVQRETNLEEQKYEEDHLTSLNDLH